MSKPTEPRPGLYRHFKGKLYQVLDVARHSETEEWFVIYKPLENDNSGLWLRPVTMFVEMVERDGLMLPRFARVPADPD